MLKILFKYIFTFIFFIIFGIFLLDYIILPSYVGYNNESYLPDVRGESLEKSTYQLNKLGFKTDLIIVPFAENIKPGTVTKMFPRAFTKVKKGRTINLTVAGKDQDIEMPNLLNLSLRNTKLILSELGIGIDTIIYEYDNSIDEGFVTFHLPKKGDLIKSSSKISFGVSLGVPPDYYIIPDITNLSLLRAKEQIISNGLRLGNLTYEYQPDLLPNTIIDQNMTPGMRVSFPASINLTVSTIKEN